MKTITGAFFYADGTPAANAKLSLKLSQDAVASGTAQISPQVINITLDAQGTIPASTKVFGNDELSPTGTYYTVSVTAPGGGVIYGPEKFQISGASPISLSSATPSAGSGVVAVGAVLQSPTGSQTVSQPSGSILTINNLVSGSPVSTISFSSTPTFNASGASAFKITLTGNVTSSTLSNAQVGQIIIFYIIQDGTGARTFTWPSNVVNGQSPDPTANAINVQAFHFDGTNAYPISMMTVN